MSGEAQYRFPNHPTLPRLSHPNLALEDFRPGYGHISSDASVKNTYPLRHLERSYVALNWSHLNWYEEASLLRYSEFIVYVDLSGALEIKLVFRHFARTTNKPNGEMLE